MRPTGCESQVDLPKPLNCRTVRQVLWVAPWVWFEGWWSCLPGPSRKWREEGARGGDQTVAVALRIDWIDGHIEAEQQKWVSLQAPAQPEPEWSARGRLTGRRGGGCHIGLAERLEKNLRVKMTPPVLLPRPPKKNGSPSYNLLVTVGDWSSLCSSYHIERLRLNVFLLIPNMFFCIIHLL